MKNQRIVIIIIISIVLISSGIIFWFSEIESNKRLQSYKLALEQSNCLVEEYPFSDSDVASTEKIYYFSDFQSFAIQEEIDHIFWD